MTHGTRTTAPAVSACSTLDRDARVALHELLEEYFPPPNTLVCGMHSNEAEFRALRGGREQVIPCLLEFERRGLANTGLWSRRDGPPDVRRWTLGMIGQIDPILAIRLYSMEVTATSDRWKRLALRLQMLQLGDRASADAIVAILGEIDPASLRPHDRETPTEAQGLEAIYVLVRYDDRDVLPVLKAVRRAVEPDRQYLGVWVAQLERDLPALERFARDGSTWSFAFDSLGRIGARDVLARLAADPKVYGRDGARTLLEKGAPPLPPAVVAASPCFEIDSRGSQELAYWVDETFPPPGFRGSEDPPGRPLALIRQADVSAACIEDIFRHGLLGTGFWRRSDTAPYGGTWMLNLLGQVDPARAALVWREWRDAPGRTAWQRGYADLLRVQLGERDGVVGLVAFLREPPDPYADHRSLGGLVNESAAVLIQIDHRPAWTLLEKWRNRGYLQGWLFDIGMAQLARDATSLERFARGSEQPAAAIEALGFIGARETLKQLADDPNYKYRVSAMGELDRRR